MLALAAVRGVIKELTRFGDVHVCSTSEQVITGDAMPGYKPLAEIMAVKLRDDADATVGRRQPS